MVKLNFLFKRLLMLASSFFIIILCLSGCSSQTIPSSPVTGKKNTANIIIKRDARLWGAAFTAPIYINHTLIGRVGNGRTLRWTVPSGQTTISTSEGIAAVKFQRKDASVISFDAQKNKTYYIKVFAPYQVNFVAPAYELKLLNP